MYSRRWAHLISLANIDKYVRPASFLQLGFQAESEGRPSALADQTTDGSLVACELCLQLLCC